MVRSILAVLAGFLAWGVICVPVSIALVTAMPGYFRPDWGTHHVGMNILYLILTVGFSVVSGFVTATVAREEEMKHVLAQGLLNLAVGSFVQIQAWAAHPVWYHLSFLILLIPGIWLGGKLRLRWKMRVAAV